MSGWSRLRRAAAITIDLGAPFVTAVDPAPGSSVVGLRSPFSVTFNEAIDPGTWSNSGLIVQSATGTLVAGRYAYDPVTRTGTFVPSLPLQPGAAYVVTVGGVTDVAGNRVSPIDSWTVTPLAPVSLEAKLQPTVVGRGGSASLDLTLAGAPLPAIVEISARSGTSAEFLPLSGPLIVNGRLTTVVTPEMNTTYRIQYAGAFGVASAQVDLPLLVRRSVVLIGPKSATVSTARVGASVKLVTAVEPAASGVSVSFRLYRFDRSPSRVGLCRKLGTEHGCRRSCDLPLEADGHGLVLLAGLGGVHRRVREQHEPGLSLVRQPLTGRSPGDGLRPAGGATFSRSKTSQGQDP